MAQLLRGLPRHLLHRALPRLLLWSALLDVVVSALASGMAVLLSLDLVRLAVVGTPLAIGGKLYEVTG